MDALEGVVASACAQVDARLLEVVGQRCQFQRHCEFLRRYLLLGQGDYVQALLDLVGRDPRGLPGPGAAPVQCRACLPPWGWVARQQPPQQGGGVCIWAAASRRRATRHSTQVEALADGPARRRPRAPPPQVEPVLQQPASQVSELTLGDLLKQALSSTGPAAEDEELMELLAARKDATTGAARAGRGPALPAAARRAWAPPPAAGAP